MIYATIEKFNKNNFEKLASGEWFDRADLYTIANALESYMDELLNRGTLTEEREIYYTMIKEKIMALVLDDLKAEE